MNVGAGRLTDVDCSCRRALPRSRVGPLSFAGLTAVAIVMGMAVVGGQTRMDAVDPRPVGGERVKIVSRGRDGQPNVVVLDLGNGIERRVVWYETGQIYYSTTTRAGKLDGLEEQYYGNGVINHRYEFRSGKAHGLHRNWAMNGVLVHQFRCVHGNVVGAERWWHQDGEEIGTAEWDGKGKWTGTRFRQHWWGATIHDDSIGGISLCMKESVGKDGQVTDMKWYACDANEVGTQSETVIAECEYRDGKPYSGTAKTDLGQYLCSFATDKEGELIQIKFCRSVLSRGDSAESEPIVVQIVEGSMSKGEKHQGVFVEVVDEGSHPPTSNSKWRVETWNDGKLQSQAESTEFRSPLRHLPGPNPPK